MNSKASRVFFSIISVPFFLYPSISTPSSSNIELSLNLLEERVRRGLEDCIKGFEEQSTPWYAFNDALRELDKYGMVTAPFSQDALEYYGIYSQIHICYEINMNINKMNKLIEEIAK